MKTICPQMKSEAGEARKRTRFRRGARNARFPRRLNRLARSSIGGVGNQVRREVTVERSEGISPSGRVPEADVAIGTDHDHAAPREAGTRRVDARVARDLHEPGPASA